ncbi:hypothetical protein TNCV_153621 [Trichonephila clavipes]|nr:hypothetical protein TNCV_153621 [Trichonephila clavipes]
MHGSLFVASHFNHAIVERLRWCKEHVGWDRQNWSRVMFSYESRFSVTSGTGHQLLSRERVARHVQKFVRERDRYGSGLMVLPGIMRNGRKLLHIFERRSVTSQRYCKDTKPP